jgi:hypothetical protein
MRELNKSKATPEEFDKIIKKYRGLDSHGKEMVDFVLDKEWTRSTSSQAPEPLSIVRTTEPDSLLPNAAHDIDGATEEQKAYADALMDDDSIWEK